MSSQSGDGAAQNDQNGIKSRVVQHANKTATTMVAVIAATDDLTEASYVSLSYIRLKLRTRERRREQKRGGERVRDL